MHGDKSIYVERCQYHMVVTDLQHQIGEHSTLSASGNDKSPADAGLGP
jgi:hypothetical protein